MKFTWYYKFKICRKCRDVVSLHKCPPSSFWTWCVCVCVCVCVYVCMYVSGFGGIGVACWPLVPKFAGFKPGRKRRIYKGEKILSEPSFGGEVKLSVPCRRFSACKRSVNVAWKSTFRQNYRTIHAHKFHLSLLGSLASAWGHLVAERIDVVWSDGGSGNV